jgi:hypothetical protein
MPDDVLGVISVVRIYEYRPWRAVSLHITSSHFAHFPSLKKVEVHSWALRGSDVASFPPQGVVNRVRDLVAEGVDVTSVDAAIPYWTSCRDDIWEVR